jgi:N-acetyl sugar amidotransferase
MKEFEIKYNLPKEVRYCEKCVISNQKPNSSIEHKNKDGKRSFINFDEEGVCSACRYNEIKNKINWDERENKLKKLLDKYRRNDGEYDVIVPSSGGKDSAYAAHILKYRYDMNPLTVTWAPHIYTQVGWGNLQAFINIGGFENILFTPNGKVHRLLTQLAFRNLLHPFQPFVLGQKNIGPKISTMYNVPLVMYGESNVEYGDPETEDEVMTQDFYSLEDSLDNTFLGGVSASDLIKDYDLKLIDLKPYLPLNPELLKKTETAVHYLGHYLPWDPQECYYYAFDNTGFKAANERSEGTYSKYSEIDDKLIPFHFYCMHIKFGIGRAMYDAAQEVRNNKITRKEGVALIRKFDGEYPERFLDEILEYMHIAKNEFTEIIDSFRSPHLWKKEREGWELRFPIS